MSSRNVQVFKNPLTWNDIFYVTFFSIMVAVVFTLNFLIFQNERLFLTFAILTPIVIVGHLLPTMIFHPYSLRLEQDNVKVRTRFGRCIVIPYRDIDFVKLGNGEATKGIKYGVFKTIFQDWLSYFIPYEAAVALINRYQENTGEAPRIRYEP